MEISPLNHFSFVKLLDVVCVVDIVGLFRLAKLIATNPVISGDHMIQSSHLPYLQIWIMFNTCPHTGLRSTGYQPTVAYSNGFGACEYDNYNMIHVRLI